MKHTLLPLPYAYDALEPYLDAKTMAIHHDKHHQTYVDKLNATLEKYPEWQEKSLTELLKNLSGAPEDIRTAVRNHAGGVASHNLFWPTLKKDGGKPSSDLALAIDRDFGTLEKFSEMFTNAAVGLFGSGWVWLVVDQDKKLQILSRGNQDNPLSDGFTPILNLDIWEHAYYLQYQNRRVEYISAWWNIVNWEVVGSNYAKALAGEEIV